MSHPSPERLLDLALGIRGEEDRDHVKACPTCVDSYRRLEEEEATLRAYYARLSVTAPRPRWVWPFVLKAAAAALLLGLLAWAWVRRSSLQESARKSPPREETVGNDESVRNEPIRREPVKDDKTAERPSEKITQGEPLKGDASPSANARRVDWRSLTAANSGSIKIVFRFDGKPPKNKVEPCEEAKGYCKQMHPDGLEMEDVVIKDGRLVNVFARISKGLESMLFDPSSDEFVVHQAGCQYKPHVFAVMTHQPVAWVNDDDTGHNVKKDQGINIGFSHGQDKRGAKDVDLFANEEFMVPIGCNVHGWMSCYMNVVRHPYFDVSGEDGVATIRNVPPGDYTLEFLHESPKIISDRSTVDVRVEVGKTIELTVTYKRK